MLENQSDFNWTLERIYQIRNQIQHFKSFITKPITDANFAGAYKTAYDLCDVFPLIACGIKDKYILRGRPNFNGQIFKEKWEISYNSKEPTKIPPGRFNRAEEPMFYASKEDQVGVNHFCLVAIRECYKKLYSAENIDPFQYITIGKWYLDSPLFLLNLLNSPSCLKVNPLFNNLVTDGEQQILKDFPVETAHMIIEFWKFLSDLAGKAYEDSQDHFITTAFSTAFIAYRKATYNEENGIIYLSTMTENNGLNVLLTPTIVDKFLKLRKVFMIKLVRQKENFYAFDIEQCSNEADVIDEKFELKVFL